MRDKPQKKPNDERNKYADGRRFCRKVHSSSFVIDKKAGTLAAGWKWDYSPVSKLVVRELLAKKQTHNSSRLNLQGVPDLGMASVPVVAIVVDGNRRDPIVPISRDIVRKSDMRQVVHIVIDLEVDPVKISMVEDADASSTN